MSKAVKQPNTTALHEDGMRPADLASALTSLFEIKRYVHIKGPPGIGKTSIVRQVAEDLNVNYIEVHGPTMVVEDFGIPFPHHEAKTFDFYSPGWWPSDPHSKGILCFDDAAQMSTDLQKVVANIVQARNLHGKPLPDGWMVISTGNRMQDRAGAIRQLSHLDNRRTVLGLRTDFTDWTDWAMNNNVRPEVIAFVHFNPGRLNEFDPNAETNATPRSWVEGVSHLIDVVPKHVEFECFAGAVGQGAATEFMGFLRHCRELPDPEDIIKKPDTHPVPEEAHIRYAIVTSLATRADAKNFDNVAKFFSRLPAEYTMLGFRLIMRKDKDNTLMKISPTYTSWLLKNQDLLSGAVK